MTLDRREFLKMIGLGSMGALGFTFFGCGNEVNNEATVEETEEEPMTEEEKEAQETFNQNQVKLSLLNTDMLQLLVA